MFKSTINNYDAMNRAIDIELARHSTSVRFRMSQAFLNVCLGIGVLGLVFTLAMVVYLLMLPHTRTSQSVSSSDKVETRTDLAELDKRETQHEIPYSLLPPEKEYTAFITVRSESGEAIVTGKQFEAGRWEIPKLQYCYLRLPNSPASGIPLAEIDKGGAIRIVTKEDILIEYAKQYCRFESI